jgi:phage-related protein
MATDFTWLPDMGAERSVASTVKPVAFGDGYEVRTTTSINVTPRKWSLSFTTPLQAHKDILSFLTERKGVTPFRWQDPLGDEALYKCIEWKSSQQGFGVFAVSATFEEVYG